MSLASVAVNLTAAGIVVAVWEWGKWVHRSFQDRNHTWLTFYDRDQAQAAIAKVNKYCQVNMFDDAQHAVVDANYNADHTPYFTVRVPKAMIGRLGYEAALRDFRKDIEAQAEAIWEAK